MVKSFYNFFINLLLRWLLLIFIFFTKLPWEKLDAQSTLILFTGCLSIFLNHPNTVPQATYGYLPLIVQYLCDLRGTMPRHSSPGTSHPNPYLGRRRISPGVAIILSICLCSNTQLDCNQLVIHLKFVFIHVNIAKVLLVVKTLIRSATHYSAAMKIQSSSQTNLQP